MSARPDHGNPGDDASGRGQAALADAESSIAVIQQRLAASGVQAALEELAGALPPGHARECVRAAAMVAADLTDRLAATREVLRLPGAQAR
jgi:hypothetical protein